MGPIKRAWPANPSWGPACAGGLAMHQQAGPRTLVTGGAGFLGSHLCERLLAMGRIVICVDNFLTGSEQNLAGFRDHPNFRLVRADIVDPLDLPVDEIYNLASPASPVDYLAHPIATVKTNVYGAVNMLELATRQNATILQASTSEVYGDPEISPQREEYWGRVNPIGVRACYNEGKRCAETLFFDYRRTRGARVKIARLFNAYGPRMRLDDGRAPAEFIANALRGEPLTIYGDGLQTRSFCYVDDLIEGMIRLMATASDTVGPINLGAPEECAILDLAKLILELTGSDSALRFLPLREDDPRRRLPDIGKAVDQLNWRPHTTLRAGLERTVDHVRCRLHAAERAALG